MTQPTGNGAEGAQPDTPAPSTASRRRVLWQQVWPLLVLFGFASLWFGLLLALDSNTHRLLVFWLIALLPSLLALGYRMLGGRRSLRARVEMVQQYRAYAQRYAAHRAGGEMPLLSTAGVGDEELEQQPRTAQFLLGAVALSVPFLVVATVSATAPGLVSGEPAHQGQAALRGMVFAGYGVFVYTLMLLIYRMHAAALSSEFLIASTFRVLITLTMGFTAGLVNLLDFGTTGQTLFLYFLIGAFPTWALQALRRRVKGLLRPSAPGEERLSLEYVDGITDQVTERLEELGISDIQHLATAEPGELSLRTLYPITRIMDWIDQAILINYLRDKIVFARQVGIHGAIDMQLTYRDAQLPSRDAASGQQGPALTNGAPVPLSAPMDPGWRARAMLHELATRSGLGLPAVYGIGATLADDYQVDFLSNLWDRRGLSKGPRQALIDAIGRALLASGVQAPKAQLGPEGIPECAWDPAHTEDPSFQEHFRAKLAAELGQLSLAWTGSFDDLRGQCRYLDLYGKLLEHIEARPAREVPRPAPPPPRPPETPLHH